MRRREFVATLTAGILPAALDRPRQTLGFTAQAHASLTPNARLQRIAISSWSLRKYLRSSSAAGRDTPGPTLALLDVPDVLVERFKVHHFEFSSDHFPSTDPTYLAELRVTLTRTGSSIVNLPVDIPECGPEGTFSDADPDVREDALDTVKFWVDVAHSLGAHAVEVGPGKVDRKNLARIAGAYKALATYARPKNVQVMVGNRAGFGAEDPEELIKVMKLAGPGTIGAAPDFATFADEATQMRGLKTLFPFAPTLCHASTRRFGANGTEVSYNLLRAMAIAKDTGFRGVFSIEFDGPGDSYAGIQRTLDELLKYV